MLGPPVLAGCYTKPKGAVVLRSSTSFCTLADAALLTELWPTFDPVIFGSKNFGYHVRFRPNMRNREISYRT
jgi:hypothetical protein